MDRERRTEQNTLNLDDVVATQPELGPSIPDGGFGWVVFIGTLFFQALVPCLIVNFGIFLAFSKLEHGTNLDKNPQLWDDRILYVPLFFCIGRFFFDSFARSVASISTTPRLIAVVGTCLTCAGLLFMWMGMTNDHDLWLFAPAGLLSGIGSSILMVQCETIVAQYFRMKLPILTQISHCVCILGFMIAPVVLGPHIMNKSLTQVLLWYQAIILQGLVVSLLFKKPLYLKSKKRARPYQFISSNPDDDEDILTKNARELQIKRQTSTESHVTKIPIAPEPSTSSAQPDQNQKWESFEEEKDVKYEKLKEWEVFDDEDEINSVRKEQNWERFDEDRSSSPRIVNDLSLAEETGQSRPSPLFSDLPVNNNNTYAYNEEIVSDAVNSNVFLPNQNENENFRKIMDVLKQPTFYKSLWMMVANTYSFFVFYTLFPSYLYIQADAVNIRQMAGLVGALSLVNLVFLCVFYWIHIDKKKRSICFWGSYWVGAVGYFMIADFNQESEILIGGLMIVLSIGALDHFAKPILTLPVRGGTSSENSLLTVFSALSLFLFLFLNISFKGCFRMMAIIHFFTGTLWLGNFLYKRLRIR